MDQNAKQEKEPDKQTNETNAWRAWRRVFWLTNLAVAAAFYLYFVFRQYLELIRLQGRPSLSWSIAFVLWNSFATMIEAAVQNFVIIGVALFLWHILARKLARSSN